MKPSGHSSVMAQRGTAPEGLDYFPTPPWAARAGGELILRIDPAAASCWEPACGEGHMAWGLKDYFDEGVQCSDIHDYGDPFGALATLGGVDVYDFLSREDPGAGVDWIVSNPPFVAGEAFVRAGLKRAQRGVAMLLRSVFLESAARHQLFTDPDLGFAVAAQFAERCPMVKGRWDPGASSATAYSWFVWVKPGIGLLKANGELGYAIRTAQRHHAALSLIIPPGTRQRLSKREDLAQFCGGDGGELFGEGNA